MTAISIIDIAGNKAPFEDEYGIGSEEFISIDEILDREIDIINVKPYENDKGPGVFALISVEGEIRYIATHSVGLVGMMTDSKVRDILETGQQVTARIVKRKSKKSDRMVYSFA